jgi:hypothetical protein
VSTSSSPSPIVAFAWDPAGNGSFAGGGSVLATTFATAGAHHVSLRVTDAEGLSSVVTETIPVGAPRYTLMQPFPVVRIAGSDNRFGARVSLLSVQAPIGARVSITCRGRGCPAKHEQRLASSSRAKAGVVVLAFRRFERSLRAGIVLEIRVSKAGEIGKYTSFRIRRGRLPVRADLCLGPVSNLPMPCPSS